MEYALCEMIEEKDAGISLFDLLKSMEAEKKFITLKDGVVVDALAFTRVAEILPDEVLNIDSDKLAIAMEVLREYPALVTGTAALIKLTEAGLSTDAEDVSVSTELTLSEKRYAAKMVVTWEEIE